MKIELGISIYQTPEIKCVDAALESILEKTKNDINTTLYLNRCTDTMFEDCYDLSKKYGVNFKPVGENYYLHSYEETRHRAFEINNADCAMILQSDVLFTKKDAFDLAMDEASQYFDSKYKVCISSDHPDDTNPLAIELTTKLGWDKIGCADSNYYPAAGSEVDEYRRSYLIWGCDPNDREKYIAPQSGLEPPEWTHYIRTPNLLHIGKPWSFGSKIFRSRPIEYSMAVCHDCILHNSWVPYHLAKWGCHPWYETFIHPFGDSNEPLKIEWEVFDNPYPTHKFVSLRGLVA